MRLSEIAVELGAWLESQGDCSVQLVVEVDGKPQLIPLEEIVRNRRLSPTDEQIVSLIGRKQVKDRRKPR